MAHGYQRRGVDDLPEDLLMRTLDAETFLQELDEGRVIAAVQEALRIDSVFGNEAAVGRYLRELMANEGMDDVEFQDVQEGRANVIGTLRGTGSGPVLLLQGHMDTVPAGSHPEPFSGALRDGRIWGRGASDDKGPLVAAILAAGLAKRIAGPLEGTCMVAGTVDEESEKRGAFGLVDRRVGADFGINVEPTDLRIAIAQKGCVSLRVTTAGVAAHGSNPHLGQNAIEKMADVIRAIREAPRPREEFPGIGTVEGTYNVGVIEGGQMFFIVPDRCSVWVDRRTIPGETQDQALAELRRVVAEVDPEAEVVVERQDWSWERIQRRGIGSCAINAESPIVQAVAQGVESVLGEEPVFHLQNAWCETDFLINDLGIPTVNFGPGKMELAHTSDEHIEVDSLLRGVAVLAWVIAKTCGGRSAG
jgi:acetylornithine deacetylase/succinyl-diaminopimelate desuccinylase family protein